MLKILLALYFIGIMLSISVMDGAATLLFLFLLFESRKQQVFKKTGLEKIFIAWLVVVSLGFLLNSAKDVPWLSRLLDLKWMINCYISYWAVRLFKPTERVEKFTYWTICLFMIYAISVTVLGYDPVFPHRTDLHPANFLGGVRTPGFLGNPMTFAHSTGIVFCYVYGMWLVKFQQKLKLIDWLKNNWLHTAAVVLTGVALLFSFTRGVWFSIAVASLVMTFIFRPKFAIILLIGGLISVGGLFVASSGFQERIKIAVDSKHESNQERLTLWKANWEMFKDYPVLGIGYQENFRQLSVYYKRLNVPDDFFKSNAHNQYLNQLSGTGIFGLLVYLMFIGTLFFWTIRILRRAPYDNLFERGIILAYFGVLTHIVLGGLFECNFEDSETLHAFFLITGVMLWIKWRENQQTIDAR